MTTTSSSRVRAAFGAAVTLLVLALAGHSPSELARRETVLTRFAPRELAVRRVGGSGTAFHRAYFVFLEGARRRLPASARGVALYGVPDADPYLYLAAYQLAPREVRRGIAGLPPGWVIAAFGPEAPPGARLLVRWDDGGLWEPGS